MTPVFTTRPVDTGIVCTELNAHIEKSGKTYRFRATLPNCIRGGSMIWEVGSSGNLGWKSPLGSMDKATVGDLWDKSPEAGMVFCKLYYTLR